jgi:AcrR family transcriptional regulator
MVQNNRRRPRGRPRAFQSDTAIARALETFWTGGYEGTSLDELSAATGMNRPSLYGAFGDKRALFLRALEAYRVRGGGVMAAVAEQGGPLRARLSNAYRAALDIYFGGENGPRGCFFTGAATVGAVEDPEVAAAIRMALEEIDASFAALFAWAQKQGDLPPEADPAALGRIASSFLHSLSIRARTGTPRKELEWLADEMIGVLLQT